MTLRLVVPLRTLSDDLRAIGAPSAVVARAEALEASARRLRGVERLACEVVRAASALEASAEHEIEAAAVRECEAIRALRVALGGEP